jgi:hypothetical protein
MSRLATIHSDEPVSKFILLKQYAHDRTATTWTQALAAACAGLPITVVQGTSDEATALRRHFERDPQAHHSRDLFHLQHDVGKASARARREADAEVAAAEEQVQRDRAPPPLFEQLIECAATTASAPTTIALAQGS